MLQEVTPYILFYAGFGVHGLTDTTESSLELCYTRTLTLTLTLARTLSPSQTP